ncbi:hypothetical protein EYC58_00265 [Candidatus Saccharibacteria bacterium]|nr:MAG: hypothetical protein EYC58_00265 [Candidatus Saccharibacteria bacterium]
MTNEELFEDLKQFIDGRFSQQDARIDARFAQQDQKFENLENKLQNLEGKFENLEGKFQNFEGKFDELRDFVAEAVTTSNDVSAEDVAALEQRVAKLEQAAA